MSKFYDYVVLQNNIRNVFAKNHNVSYKNQCYNRSRLKNHRNGMEQYVHRMFE